MYVHVFLKAGLKYPYFSLPVFLVAMMLMLMMMVMTVHNFTPWWMLTPAAINFTPHAGKTADVSLSPALPPLPVIDFTTIVLSCIELLAALLHYSPLY